MGRNDSQAAGVLGDTESVLADSRAGGCNVAKGALGGDRYSVTPEIVEDGGLR